MGARFLIVDGDTVCPDFLRHADAIRMQETTSCCYEDVPAVMGRSSEVHRRIYLARLGRLWKTKPIRVKMAV